MNLYIVGTTKVRTKFAWLLILKLVWWVPRIVVYCYIVKMFL